MLVAAIARAKQADVSPEQIKHRLVSLATIAGIGLFGTALSLVLIGTGVLGSQTAYLVTGFGLILSILLMLACGIGGLLLIWTAHIYRSLAALDLQVAPTTEEQLAGNRFAGLEFDKPQESAATREPEPRVPSRLGVLMAIDAFGIGATLVAIIRLWPAATAGPGYTPPEQLVVVMISLMGCFGALLRLAITVMSGALQPAAGTRSFSGSLLLPFEGTAVAFIAYVLLRGLVLSPGLGISASGQLNLFALYGIAGVLGFLAVDIMRALSQRIDLLADTRSKRG